MSSDLRRARFPNSIIVVVQEWQLCLTEVSYSRVCECTLNEPCDGPHQTPPPPPSFHPQNFPALLFIKPVPLYCSSLTLQTKWGSHAAAWGGGRSMCARLHLVIHAPTQSVEATTACQGRGWGDNCSDAERRRSRLHPWLFPSCLMCLSPSFSQLFLPFSASLSSSGEIGGGVLSFRAHRRKDLEIFYFFPFSGSVYWIMH